MALLPLFFIIFMSFIDGICQKLVCPPKLNYSSYDLGPIVTPYSKRTDFNVVNANGLRINASFYEIKKATRCQTCVVYLHSMNGSRLQSLVYVQEMLKMGMAFCNFDFTGCGNSEGKSISFGANQKHDVYAIVQLLKLRFDIKRVFLWGRSMGSACAIKYCQMLQMQAETQHPQIQILGLILDSCFKSFSQLVVQIGHQKAEIPQFLVKAGYYIIKGTLQQMGKFKTDELQLQQFIATIKLPVLFLASDQDKVVNAEHSKALYEQFTHPLKRLQSFKGNHNQSRGNDYIESVKCFIKEAEYYHQGRKRYQYFEDNNRTNSRQNYHQPKNLSLNVHKKDQRLNECQCSLLPSNSNQIHFYQPSKLVKKQSYEHFQIKQKDRISFKQERLFVKKHNTEVIREVQKVRLSKVGRNYLHAAKSERLDNGLEPKAKSYNFL